MTGQVDDLFRYKGTEYAVSGISEGELFDPWPLMDVAPVLWGAGTACSRGYRAVYALHDSQLVLDELGISLYKEEGGKRTRCVGPAINGVSPAGDGGRHSLFNNHYVGLGFRLDYTGALLLGDGFIQQLYVHQGFQSFWKYTNVIELVFEIGVLVHEFDRSKQIAELRRYVIDNQSDAGSHRMPTSAELWEFVVRSFDRSYKSEWAPNKGLTRTEWLLGLGAPQGGSSLLRRLERSQQVRKRKRD